MTTILKNWKTAAAAAVFAMMPTFASAANLQSDDYVGISFWLISIAMVASTVFFYAEARRVGGKWGVSLLVAALVTLVAAVHYFYMREVWATTGESPTVYRYIDWLITVPLQMIEFYLILAAVGAATSRIFWHLLVGTLVMLLGGYFGEIGVIDATIGFVIGMAGWVYILYFIFAGEAGKNAATTSPAVQSAFSAMRLIVLVGWSIYPLGYVLGYLTGSVDAASLNGIYNIADFVNKIAFGLMIWAAATCEEASA